MPESKSPEPSKRSYQEADEDIREAVKNFALRSTKFIPNPEISSNKGEKFYKNSTINGIKIVVRWDEANDSYVIYFPQIKLDQVVRVTKNPDIARLVFNHACNLAQTNPHVYEIRSDVKEYFEHLSFDYDPPDNAD